MAGNANLILPLINPNAALLDDDIHHKILLAFNLNPSLSISRL